jgi:ABC-type Na+ transport system ATPase subunit NatA
MSGSMTEVRGSPAPATAPDEGAIRAVGLAKRYGEIEAVRGVSFDVRPGEVFAFLGPNGAGKTTTVRMLCTLARPTGGRALVAGFDVARQPRAVRRRIGLVFQEQTLDDRLTAEQNLRFHAVLYHVPRGQVEQRMVRALRLVGLEDRRHDLISSYSGGMARRLEIARGVLHTPMVLFLDEPTVGLDPQTRASIWEDVLRLRRELTSSAEHASAPTVPEPAPRYAPQATPWQSAARAPSTCAEARARKTTRRRGHSAVLARQGDCRRRGEGGGCRLAAVRSVIRIPSDPAGPLLLRPALKGAGRRRRARSRPGDRPGDHR